MINYKPKLQPIPEHAPIDAIARSLKTGSTEMVALLKRLNLQEKARLLAGAACDDGEIQVRIRAHRGEKVTVELWLMLAESGTEGILLLSSAGPVEVSAP